MWHDADLQGVTRVRAGPALTETPLAEPPLPPAVSRRWDRRHCHRVSSFSFPRRDSKRAKRIAAAQADYLHAKTTYEVALGKYATAMAAYSSAEWSWLLALDPECAWPGDCVQMLQTWSEGRDAWVKAVVKRTMHWHRP